jgi:hypothetical protein
MKRISAWLRDAGYYTGFLLFLFGHLMKRTAAVQIRVSGPKETRDLWFDPYGCPGETRITDRLTYEDRVDQTTEFRRTGKRFRHSAVRQKAPCPTAYMC